MHTLLLTLFGLSTGFQFLCFPGSSFEFGMLHANTMLGLIAFKELYAIRMGSEADATSAMNRALSVMYHSGFWVKNDVAKTLGRQIGFFLFTYQRLAHAMWTSGKNRFGMMPKLHFLAHASLQLLRQSESSNWCQNPLACSVQVQEDFIGRPSRVSRRVNIRQAHRNVINRCLILSAMALQRAYEDKRATDAYA